MTSGHRITQVQVWSAPLYCLINSKNNLTKSIFDGALSIFDKTS